MRFNQKNQRAPGNSRAAATLMALMLPLAVAAKPAASGSPAADPSRLASNDPYQAAANDARRAAFNDDWRFFRGDAPAAEQSGFDDRPWTALRLPHDWAIDGPFDPAINPHTGPPPI